MRDSLQSKFAYAISDLASNLSWGTVGSFLMIYYTDVARIPVAAIGTMFLVTRIWDAVNDPIMGLIIDKTNTRWGKCRPYFLWMAVPLGVIMVLTYTVPEIGATGKLVYAYVTFTLLSMIYTAINIPVTAILPRLTTDFNERTVFGTFRVTGALFGSLAVGVLTLPLVNSLGGGNDAKGYMLTMLLYGVLATVFFLFTFFNIKEITLEDQAQKASRQKAAFAQGLKAAKGNLPWLLVLLSTMVLEITLTMRSAGLIYYCKYYLRDDGLVPLLNALAVLMLLPYMLLPFISKRLGKRNAVIMGSVVTLAGSFVILIGGTSVPLIIAGTIVSIFGIAFALGLNFILIADTVDYGEWKNGVRSEGFLSAAASFGAKFGTGLGGAFAAWVLGASGYVGDAVEQTKTVLAAIRFNFIIAPIIGCVIGILLMAFYMLDKQAPQMLKELEARRQS
jgi:GPH family glycoside/pentoside/hexuronide:cation symporter